MKLEHGPKLGSVALALLVACGNSAGDTTARLRVLNAVPGDEVADVRHLGGKLLISGLRFGELSPELTVPAGAHELALVVPPEAHDVPACRSSDAPPSPCAADLVLAASHGEIVADQRALIVLSERHADNREGLVIPLRESNDGSAWNDSQATLRFVHAMPDLGTVSIEGLAGDQLRFGFGATTRDQLLPAAGLESIIVRDAEGNVVLESPLDLLAADPEAHVFTAVLIGAGSEAAPFALVLVPG